MNRYFGRLAAAFILSATGFLTTHWFFGNSGYTSRQNSDTPIAQLSFSLNEVQRKQIGKLVWESVTQGEDLFLGEDIRTAQASSARIYLVESKTTIDLDPDSLIRLEKSGDGLALNFLAGNLIVKGAGQGVTVKTGEQSIELTNADLALTKSASGSVGLEVLKGQAKLGTGGKAVTLTESSAGTVTADGLTEDKNRIRLLSPLIGEPVLTDNKSNADVTFTWQKLDPGFDVYLERGDDRHNLARVTSRKAPGEAGTITMPMKPGRWFFRLVAVPLTEGNPERATLVLPLDVKLRMPPALLEPNKTMTVLDQEKPLLKFKWTAQLPFESFTLEIATNPTLTENHQKIDFRKDDREHTLEWPKSGKFFWRMSGFIRNQGRSEAVTSEVQEFNVRVGIELIPPVAKSPLKNQNLAFTTVSAKGVIFSWENVPGINDYKIQYREEGASQTQTKQTNSNPLRILGLNPGTYTWSLASVSPDGQTSKYSEPHKFTIEKIPSLEWADGSNESVYKYFTDKPSGQVAWKSAGDSAQVYRFRWAAVGKITSETPWQTTNGLQASFTAPENGTYHVEVEALASDGSPLARTSIKSMTLEPIPLLPAPLYAADLPTELKADRRGGYQLSWREVEGAEEYLVQVKTESGEVRALKAERNLASLRDLQPGKYEISVQALDKYKRLGQESEKRILDVPNVSDIKAPKIRQMKVK